MSFNDAIVVALRYANYYKKKYYVWGFQSQRNNKWYYTFTEHRPSFMVYTKHIT